MKFIVNAYSTKLNCIFLKNYKKYQCTFTKNILWAKKNKKNINSWKYELLFQVLINHQSSYINKKIVNDN